MKPGEHTPRIPEDLAAQHNWLLEECLRDVKKVRVTAEQERSEQVRKELAVEIEKERADAKKRAEEQRKSLKLGVEDPDAPETPPQR
jgi:hypothetical protein